MKHIKIFEEYQNSELENIIIKIKKELIYDGLAIVDEQEFNERFNNLDEAWVKYVDSQTMGDCQSICSIIKFLKIPNVETHFGEIKVDYPSIQYKEEYDEEEIENYHFTHHWVTIKNTIYEFSKGTLKDNIDWWDLYNVDPEDESRYNTIR